MTLMIHTHEFNVIMGRLEQIEKRLEAIEEALKPELPQIKDDLGPPSPQGKSWVKCGVRLPDGTQVRIRHKGTLHFGVIEDGAWRVDDGWYRSPSGAALAVLRNQEGYRCVGVSGWDYWSVKRPSDTTWISLSELRLAARSQGKEITAETTAR